MCSSDLVFGIKGGAAGGGYAQVIPMEDINLHFTGDFHAIGAANNLLAAMLDNHIQQGNELGIDIKSITWKRCVDMNDRQLRSIVDGLGGKANGTPREDGFDITVASEIMAVFCLAESLADLKALSNEFVINIKDTSVLNVIGVTELYYFADVIKRQNFKQFQTYVIVCAIYFVLTFTVTRLLRLLERRLEGRNSYTVFGSQTDPDAEIHIKTEG